MTAQVPSAKDLPQDQAIGLLSGASAWLTKKVPGLGQAFVADGPHGVRARPDGVTDLGISGALPATCFPTAVTLASTWDPDLLTRIGTALGQEAKQLGVDVILGPGMNLKRHPLCGRNFEYYSEDPYLTGIMATAITKGIQGEGVGTSVKHFAVNNQETNRFVVDAVVDLRTLHELYLKGFEMTVRGARPWTVMAAYNLVNGTHCTENQYLLTKTLRQEWGFDGLVMSDWGAVADRVAGIKAGMDLEMPGSQGLWDAEVARALESGSLTRAEMDKCVQRVMDLIAKSPKLDPAQREISADMIDAHDALAREAAAAGSVLLKNDGALPLAPSGKIAVIGAFAKEPRYQGFGSSFVNPTRLTSAVDALEARGVEFDYTPGYEPLKSADDAAALTAAIVAARKADVAVVFAGLPPFIESESYDRDNLSLPAQHDALITAVASANPNTVVVLFNGAPVVMPWLDSVRAVLDVYLGGQAGGAAIVDMLYGDANPGGRLAETFPRRLADIPANANFPGSPHRVVYGEQLMVGYRYHVTSGVVPLYPFGYGLSYTSFKWSDASVDRENLEISALPEGAGTLDAACEVSVTVTNTGARAGSEVVQVYLSDRTGALPRPRRELAGFAKVVLGPGESRQVTVPIPAAAFAVWVTDGENRGWQVPSGAFELEVARNSWDVVATLPVTVTGSLSLLEPVTQMSDLWQAEV
ncbi:MAG: glycoside hydrolase family 3 C-terminal domain-containing protein, partial [Promicromonosporaceae bacterium]|nr:glycoside hydrolase family 3 C-terminal domain-containing protein [Promicromonosporaceae bacterium]